MTSHQESNTSMMTEFKEFEQVVMHGRDQKSEKQRLNRITKYTSPGSKIV